MRRLLQICGVTIGLATTVVFGLMALLAASASLRQPTEPRCDRRRRLPGNCHRRRRRRAVVLAGFVGYLLASAIMLMIGPRWWYRLVFTLVASLVMVAGLVAVAETVEPHSIGEGGLAILGPMMFSWAILPAVVGLRVLFRAMRPGAE